MQGYIGTFNRYVAIIHICTRQRLSCLYAHICRCLCVFIDVRLYPTKHVICYSVASI